MSHAVPALNFFASLGRYSCVYAYMHAQGSPNLPYVYSHNLKHEPPVLITYYNTLHTHNLCL